MCTLTIVPQAGGVRIACNRDESRLRPPARAPELRGFGDRVALLPVDPVSDGTWIAASDAPLALALINVYVEPIVSIEQLLESRRRARASRGTIIPHMLEAGSVRAAFDRARRLEAARFEPFRLIIIGQRQVAEVVWSAGKLVVRDPAPIDRPLFFTSSGLGDAVVADPRRKLFDESFAAGSDWVAAQDAYHRHVWPDREFASVWMTRPEARTVSLTVVELGPRDVQMRYYAREDDTSPAGEAVCASLHIAAGASNVTR